MTRCVKDTLNNHKSSAQPCLKCLKDSEEPKERMALYTSVALSRHTGLNIAWYTRLHHAQTPQPCISQHLWMSIVCVPCGTQFGTRNGKLSSRSVSTCYKSMRINQCKKKMGQHNLLGMLRTCRILWMTCRKLWCNNCNWFGSSSYFQQTTVCSAWPFILLT